MVEAYYNQYILKSLHSFTLYHLLCLQSQTLLSSLDNYLVFEMVD